MTAIFVTATGTDIGKTFVTAGLIRHYRKAGGDVGAIKPVMTGFSAEMAESSDAAVLLDPNDDSGWAEAIESLFDPVRAADLRAAGLRRAASFTWQRAAATTVDVYRQALGDRG